MATNQTLPITCSVCGHTEQDFLVDHILEAHALSVEAYLVAHPGTTVVSSRLLAKQASKSVRRAHPPKADALSITLGGMDFPVNLGVTPEACLPSPEGYALPTHGSLGKDVLNALVALKCNRSLYIWGLPGSGKDALFHYWSASTRTPAIIRQVVPGSDIESWFFSRSFDQHGTAWEEGAVLQALRDGYICADGKRIPYMLLVSDLDRADRSQAEYLRLITDSIQGRVSGPAGKTYKVLPGTMIVATANTAGGGDSRGRMISANPLDASILDRFERKFQFSWLDWADEEPIVKGKFPLLVERAPNVFQQMGNVTKALRQAITNNDLYAEFSHRGLCSILGHANDLLRCNGSRKVPVSLLKTASRAWLDGLPDPDTRKEAERIMDPHLTGGLMDEGDKSHISDGNLTAQFK